MISYRSAQKWAIWTAYALHFFIIPCVIGLVINFRKSKQYHGIEYEDDSEDTIPVGVLLSHHMWLIRSFNVLLSMAILGLAGVNFGAGLYIAGGASLWWWYRMARGMVSLYRNKPMPVGLERKTAIAAA